MGLGAGPYRDVQDQQQTMICREEVEESGIDLIAHSRESKQRYM